MSQIKSQLEESLKRKSLESLSDDKKRDIKLKSLGEILDAIENKNNRYIFYCPDIALVNPLVKLIYEVAYQAELAGYDVTILHEMNGFKAKWLYENPQYMEYRNLRTEYVINKVSKKSKRTKNLYSFRTSDTLIVTDAYQDMLENILSEETLRLIQKVVLVTGYMGLASISPGMDYTRLNVSSMVYFDDNIMQDYQALFSGTRSFIIDAYPVSKAFNREVVQADKVYPVIAVTSIGNNEKANQLMNVFYNRYPNLSVFTFKIVAREDMTNFIENISTAAAMVMLDKNIVTKQMIYEVINMGVPVVLPKRREFLDNKIIVENFVVEDDVFEIAAQLATYCQHWLTTSTNNIKKSITDIADKLELNNRPVELFGEQVSGIFSELQESRAKTFNRLKDTLINGAE